MTKHDQTAWYAETLLKGWPKNAGSKPTSAMLEVAHAFGKPGKQSFALAMAMRPEGASGQQIEAVCQKPQNNHRKGLIDAKYFKRLPISMTPEGHTVYKIELTATGKAQVEKRVKGEADQPEAEVVKRKAVKAQARLATVKVTEAEAEPVKVKKATGKAKRKPKAEPVVEVTQAPEVPQAPEAVTEGLTLFEADSLLKG